MIHRRRSPHVPRASPEPRPGPLSRLRELVTGPASAPRPTTDVLSARAELTAWGLRVPRLLVLAHDHSQVPLDGAAPDPSTVEIRYAAGGAGAARRSPPTKDRLVETVLTDPPTGRRALVRSLLADARQRLPGVRSDLARQWSRTLAGSTRARRLIEGADAVIAADPLTERALAVLPTLVRDRPVTSAQRARPVLEALTQVDSLLAEILSQRPADVGSAVDRSLEDWAERARTWGPPMQHDAHLLRRWADVSERVWVTYGHHRGPRIIGDVLAHVPLPPGPGSGVRAALAVFADISLARVSPPELTDEVIRGVVDHALADADSALEAERYQDSLRALAAAMAVLFHRALHAEVPRSPLVDDPATFLGSLRTSRSFRALVDRTTTAERAPANEDEGVAPVDEEASPPVVTAVGAPPRVLVATGVYGSFHGAVAEALSGAAEVRVRDFAADLTPLSRRSMSPQALLELAGLIGGHEASPRFGTRHLAPAVAARASEMRAELEWAQVVFSDWADRATVWLSHLCPPQTRLIVRVHALDAFDPWFHLVRWDRVEQVVVVSEPMRSLVRDLLAGAGAQVPVVVLGNVTGLPAMARPKRPGARTTLGLVGWGRVVKDPLWALELLRREPTWSLVLVGKPPPQPLPVAAEYTAALHTALDDKDLAGRVRITGHVDDVAEALRDVGVILSTSLRETWHLGLVEGVASGAVPVVRNWPLLARRGGARALFPASWVVDDLDAAEARIRRVTDPARWEEERLRAQAEVRALFDPEALGASYRRLILKKETP